MILLQGHSLAQARRVPLEALSLTLNERDSSAQMTPADMTGIGVNSWFLDDSGPGKGIVWRVRSIQENYLTRTPRVTLEHAINSLRDRLIFGEVKPGDISGTGSDSCSALQAVRYILARQDDWTLGSFDYGSVSMPYKFDGNSLYDALEYVCKTLPDCWWSYDFSRYPFRLNITRRSTQVGTRMRAGRNLATITRTVDRNGMITRFYPIGKDDLHLPEEYVERNAGTYGIAAAVEVDQSLGSVGELRSWANEQLERHAEPAVTISVTGVELADATGESLDRIRLGRICEVPLPEFGMEIAEVITQVAYQDALYEPEAVQVTMENKKQDISRIVAEAIKKAGAGGRGGARQEKEDHAWFEDTDDHVAMCAEGIIGKDAKGEPNWTRLSQIVVDGRGIYTDVQSIQQEVVIAESRITQNENQIQLEVRRAQSAEGTLSSRINVEANRITQEVTRATGEEGRLSGRITTEANKIALVVSEGAHGYEVNAASIVAGINGQGGSYVKLQADKIDLSGYVTASEFYAVDAKIDNLMSGEAIASSLFAASLHATQSFTCLGYATNWKSVQINGTWYYILCHN